MTKLRNADGFTQELQDYFFLVRPLMMAKTGAYELFAHTVLDISFLAKKISRYGLQTVLNDLHIPYCAQDYRLQALKQILVQSQDRLNSSQGEQDAFGVLHSLLTHHPDFIEFVAREEYSGDVDLPVLTALHPIVNLPAAGEFVPTQVIKTGTGLLRRHSAALSPNGKFVAISDLQIEIWDMESGKKIQEIFPEGQVSSLDFSPDNELLLVSTADKKDTIWDKGNFLSIWNFRQNLQIQMLEVHTNSVNKGFFSPDGRTIYSASEDKKLLSIDSKTGQMLRQIQTDLPVKDCVYSASGKILYSISVEAVIQAWNDEANRPFFSLPSHHGLIEKISMSRDGNFLGTVYEDGSLGIWSAQEKQELFNLVVRDAKAMDGLVSVDKNRILSIFSDRSIRIWDLTSGELKASLFYAYSDPVKCLMNPKNDCVITFGNRFIHFWDAGSLFDIQGTHYPDKENFAQHIYNQGGDTDFPIIPIGIRSCHSLSNGKFIAIDSDRKIKIWDSKSGQISKVLDGSQNAVFCVPGQDGSLLLSHDFSSANEKRKGLRIWNLADFSSRQLDLSAAKKKQPADCAVSPDGKYCVLGYSEGLLEMRDLETDQLKYQVYGHEWDVEQAKLYDLPSHENVRQCAIDPGGSYFATIAQYDSHILIWDLSSGKLLHKLFADNVNSYTFITFTSDGKHLLAVGRSQTTLGESEEHFIRFWDIPSFIASGQIPLGKINPQNYISGCALEPENRFLALAYLDGQVSIWDITNGNRIVGTRLSDSLGSCAWSNDKILMVGGEKGAYFLWLVTEVEQWRRFGRGVFDTGYQPRLHFFGDGSMFETEYEKMGYHLREHEKKPIVESIVYKSVVDVSANQEKPALVYNNAGMSLAYLKELIAAQTIFQKIGQVEISELNEFDQAVICFNKGHLEYLLENYENAKQILQEALSQFKRLRRKAWQAKTINSLASIQERLQGYEDSVQYYLQAIQLYGQSRNWNEVTELKAKISRAYKMLNSPDQALNWMTAYFQDLRVQK